MRLGGPLTDEDAEVAALTGSLGGDPQSTLPDHSEPALDSFMAQFGGGGVPNKKGGSLGLEQLQQRLAATVYPDHGSGSSPPPPPKVPLPQRLAQLSQSRRQGGGVLPSSSELFVNDPESRLLPDIGGGRHGLAGAYVPGLIEVSHPNRPT